MTDRRYPSDVIRAAENMQKLLWESGLLAKDCELLLEKGNSSYGRPWMLWSKQNEGHYGEIFPGSGWKYLGSTATAAYNTIVDRTMTIRNVLAHLPE